MLKEDLISGINLYTQRKILAYDNNECSPSNQLRRVLGKIQDNVTSDSNK